MSWWVYLQKDGKSVEVEHHKEGGTYVLDGSFEAELNITYNYGLLYRLAMGESLDVLNDKTGAWAAEWLKAAIEKLGINRYDKDYWAPTPGNAGYALSILLKWAEQHPDAVFLVS